MQACPRKLACQTDVHQTVVWCDPAGSASDDIRLSGLEREYLDTSVRKELCRSRLLPSSFEDSEQLLRYDKAQWLPDQKRIQRVPEICEQQKTDTQKTRAGSSSYDVFGSPYYCHVNHYTKGVPLATKQWRGCRRKAPDFSRIYRLSAE
jgi:hypothetical protein